MHNLNEINEMIQENNNKIAEIQNKVKIEEDPILEEINKLKDDLHILEAKKNGVTMKYQNILQNLNKRKEYLFEELIEKCQHNFSITINCKHKCKMCSHCGYIKSRY